MDACDSYRRAVGRESAAHPAINGGMRPRTYRRREPSNTPRWRRDRCGAFPALRRYSRRPSTIYACRDIEGNHIYNPLVPRAKGFFMPRRISYRSDASMAASAP